jgi:hypothetical protein
MVVEKQLSYQLSPANEVGGVQRREFLTLVALTSSSLLALPPLTQQSFADYMMPTDRTRTI